MTASGSAAREPRGPSGRPVRPLRPPSDRPVNGGFHVLDLRAESGRARLRPSRGAAGLGRSLALPWSAGRRSPGRASLPASRAHGSDGASPSQSAGRSRARSRCSYAIQGRGITSVFFERPGQGGIGASNSPPRLILCRSLSSRRSVAGGRSAAHGPFSRKRASRSGRLFVLEAEDSALEKWKATRAVLADYSRVAGG